MLAIFTIRSLALDAVIHYSLQFEMASIKAAKHYSEEARSYIGLVQHPYKMLLIGETGSGKTSFLNLLCNSKLIEELGTNIDAAKLDQIRHYNDLKIEDSAAHPMASKTSEAKLYNTEVCKTRMTVIDTPGFGDSRGLEQDKENVEKIIEALKGEENVNCVCLIINGRQSRMTASLKYVLAEISSILPKEIFNNIIVVFTYTAEALDCNFDISELDPFFGRRIECAFYIENPYCRIEKAKQKAVQLSVDQIARSLKKSFEDTAETLRSLHETIKDFGNVHTLHFITLYEQKQEIERDVIIILASYFYDQHKKNSPLQKLHGKLIVFQRLSISKQNYAKVLEKQCDVVQLRIETEVGTQREQLTALKDDLEKKLEVVNSALEQIPVHQQQDDHWVIDKDEVIITREELGRGSYATVNVGTFRGLRVAVKSLHTLIISDYNLALFSREMSIASRVRHPNLVQFIGATKVGNPLILTELMSTSLHKELQKNQLTRQQILSIAQDVALGLNYLHLFNPQPIIHRDVSSPNVLLKPSTGPAGYEAKVADYGTANFKEATGTVMPGNPAYAAPEARDPDQHSPAMDVYSYSVLLMEITLRSPPEMMTVKRERQSHNVSWSPMKSLIQRGLNTTRQRRPTMSQVIEALRGIKL